MLTSTLAPKNIIVLGGSFAGVSLTRRLCESLPSGYRAILVEKNSHFNFLFNFPRFSVVPGYEKQAFIPYSSLGKNAPKGIFQHVRGTATQITDNKIILASGETIHYDYLAIATGSSQQLPAKAKSTNREQACLELRSMQKKIQAADSIALIGGGPVGIQLAADIKSLYPHKQITLVHSRDCLLPNFGSRLQNYVLEALKKKDIRVILNERPRMDEKHVLRLSDGRTEMFDLIIPCTGQIPNSSMLKSLSPNSISNSSHRILVKPTLQLASDKTSISNVFAFGDVAETGGPRMGRAAHFQTEVVLKNIINLINGREVSDIYVPNFFIEGAIKLSLGMSDYVRYAKEENGDDILHPANDGKIDLNIRASWKKLNADMNEFPKAEVENAK